MIAYLRYKILGFDVIRQPSNGYQPERDIFKNENGKARLRLMRQVVEASFEKAQKHEGVRNGVLSVANFVVDLQTLMGAVLSTQPAVAMAWAGISAIIPVRSSRTCSTRRHDEKLKLTDEPASHTAYSPA